MDDYQLQIDRLEERITDLENVLSALLDLLHDEMIVPNIEATATELLKLQNNWGKYGH